jgi:formate dehydrogenase major subunit
MHDWSTRASTGRVRTSTILAPQSCIPNDLPTVKKTALACIPFVASHEQCDETYPLLLTTGRTLHHFNAGTMTYRTPNRLLRPVDTLDISPGDADRLGIRTGEQVTVRSRYGEAVLPVCISDRIKPGELFATFHLAASQVNRLTSDERDRLVHAPEYKVTAVRVERRPSAGH